MYNIIQFYFFTIYVMSSFLNYCEVLIYDIFSLLGQ